MSQQDTLRRLGDLERAMDELIGSGFFGEHVPEGCRLCRAHRIHDSLLVLYRLCEEKIGGECDTIPTQPTREVQRCLSCGSPAESRGCCRACNALFDNIVEGVAGQLAPGNDQPTREVRS